MNNVIGINLDKKNSGESGYYAGNWEDGFNHIPLELLKKHKKLIDNSKIVIKVDDCYVKEVKFKY